MDKKIVIDSFLEFIQEVLTSWIDNTGIKHTSAASTIPSLTKKRLVKINVDVNRIKEDFKLLFDAYKELEKTYELKQLSVEYQIGSIDHRNDVEKLLVRIRNIASDYSYFIEQSKQEKIIVDEHITPSNQKSIEFLANLYEDDLLKIIETGHLAGL